MLFPSPGTSWLRRNGSWTEHFCRLLRQLAPAVPAKVPVPGLCDQGLCSRDLWAQIVAFGYTFMVGECSSPWLRYQSQVTFQPEGQTPRVPERSLIIGTGRHVGGPRRHLSLPATPPRDLHRTLPSLFSHPGLLGPPHHAARHSGISAHTGPFCPHAVADSRLRRHWPSQTRGGLTDPDATIDSHPGNTLVNGAPGARDPRRLRPCGRQDAGCGSCARGASRGNVRTRCGPGSPPF